jgi:aryl-alcohol dehydrogenase-like predicted oxidoreductase
LLTRRLGSTGPTVSALGLGRMGMSGLYRRRDGAQSTAAMHAGLDAGVTLRDTGDYQGMGHNALLVARALRGRERRSPGAVAGERYPSAQMALLDSERS